MTTTIGALVGELGNRFRAAGLPQPQLEARTLVLGVLDVGLSELLMRSDCDISDEDVARVRAAGDRRCRREPVHRILGRRSFYDLDLVLSPETLEPRPDTETLVDAALPIVHEVTARKGYCRIADLGTGSGAICLALLSKADEATGLGTDICEEALETAKRNAERNGLASRFSVRRGRWIDALDGSYDLIVSNPPYIPTAEIAILAPEVRDFDPHAALDGGDDGLDSFRTISAGVGRHLAPDGHIAVETGFDQQDAVVALFRRNGFDCIKRATDLGGNDRVAVFAHATNR
ncbi:MAG: peptide chain release factor N(5)-glutamine methyltransferase [Pseudomonadota bacterium]